LGKRKNWAVVNHSYTNDRAVRLRTAPNQLFSPAHHNRKLVYIWLITVPPVRPNPDVMNGQSPSPITSGETFVTGALAAKEYCAQDQGIPWAEAF
jgi:hypothetical protein